MGADLTGIPAEPVALPPDDRLKRIRFTPIERMTKIPVGTIVELSYEEVQKISAYRAAHPNCPACGRPPTDIFWYKHGLEPDIQPDAEVQMMCQYCGLRDW